MSDIQKLTCVVAHPLKFQLTYDTTPISTSFGLRNMDLRKDYQLFLNNIHYRNNCNYTWTNGTISHSQCNDVGLLTISVKRQPVLEFTMGDACAYSIVERILYRFLQVAEETADRLVQ